MLVMFECTVVGQRLRNLRELRSLTVPKQALQARPQRIPRSLETLVQSPNILEQPSTESRKTQNNQKP